MSGKIKAFFGNWIVKNLLLAAAIVVVLVTALSIFLNIYTNHNKDVVVPDFGGIPAQEAVSRGDSIGLRVNVIDSVYIRNMGRGLVYSQNPPYGSRVKKGHRINLVINSVTPKKVRMPDVVGLSLRQARTELSSRGLRVGRLIYIRDIATNNVLRQLYRGEEIEPGTMVETLSAISLEIGLNPAEASVVVPNVIGMKYLRALDAVHEASFNLGSVRFDATVNTYADSLEAFVWKQLPEADSLSWVQRGENMSLYLTRDGNKLPRKENDEEL